MLLAFERGSASEPRGHALAYFRNASAPGELYATYLIVPPIAIDLAKYMPPMFASKISLADLENVSAIPLPPVPEKVESREYLRRLAESREDDIVFLGTANIADIQEVLGKVGEAAQEYLHAYTAYLNSLPALEPGPDALSATVEDVLYSLMSERDKLSELAKLVGKLRYAVDGGDAALMRETLHEMEVLGSRLPGKYRLERLSETARLPGERGWKLSELHIARCYKLCEEDYRAVEELDSRIRELEAQA